MALSYHDFYRINIPQRELIFICILNSLVPQKKLLNNDFEHEKKDDFVTATNICDTDHRALFPYRLQSYLLKYYLTTIFCHLYYFLVTITIFLVTVTT